MDTSFFINELLIRNPVLAWAATIHLCGLAIAFFLSLIDKRKVTGVNVWVKPMKFFSSIAIFLFTMCWILFYIPGNTKWISLTIAIVMYIEMFLISFQAARGTTSHFNTTSAFNGIIFSIMGLAITVNSLLCIYILILFFNPEIKISASYLWGIRAGLFIFILASFEGFAMAKRSSHSVGIKDGGKGFPFLNWSREGGDLRIAHFVGIHALQILPLSGIFIKNVPAVIIISFIYFVISAYLFIQAVKGRAFLKFSLKNKEGI